MFGTIRYDRESQHAEFIDRTESILGDAATEHAACDKCRLTKLRCTGQRSGCDRCQARGIQCVYSAAGSRDSRKGRKNTGSVDLKVKKPREKKSEKSKEKPKRQGKASSLKKTVNAKPKAAAQRGLDSVGLSDGCEGAKVVQPGGQMSRNDVYGSQAIQPKIERGLEEETDRFVQHGVLGVLTTWPQPHQLGLDLAMTTSPYDGPPEMPLDPGFLPTSLIATSNYTVVEPDVSPDDDNFAFFTSDSPFTAGSDSSASSSPDTGSSSGITSPTFTNAASSPITADGDIDMPYIVENDETRSCSCIGLISDIMDEVDDQLHPVPTSTVMGMSTTPFNPSSSSIPTVDSTLASLKTQISTATTVMQCTLCQSRDEHLSLLIRACEMVVRLAERVVACYQAREPPMYAVNPFRHYSNADRTSTPPPTPAPSHFGCLSTVNPANINLPDALTSTATTQCLSPRDERNTSVTGGMFFGRYKTDPSEYETLMRVLIILQLRALAGVLLNILRRGTEGPGSQEQHQHQGTCRGDRGAGSRLSEKQIARVHAAQSVVGSLIVRLEVNPQGFL